MKTFAILAVSSSIVLAAKQATYEALNDGEQATIREKLSKWKTLYGPIAEAHGFVPSRESLQVDSHTNDELERFHSTILQVEQVSKQNPHATFSEFNQFALLTDEEFSAFLGASFGNHSSTNKFQVTELADVRMESEIDWTTSTCMSPVKEQGNCGSCWAFSTLGTSEFAHCLATGEKLDLSEQQVVGCDTQNHGCKGGYPPNAIDWIASGVCTEEAWPYTSGVIGQTGYCDTKCTKKQLSIGETVLVSGETALQNALNKQPVTIVVEAGNAVWKNYKGGVISKCPGSRSDHAVIAVGYGTSTADYFKIKNSWGPQWGDNGYIYLQRGGKRDGVCNVGEAISYPKLVGGDDPKPQPSTNSPTPSKAPVTKSPSTSAPVTDTPSITTLSPPPTSTPKPKKTHKPKPSSQKPATTTSPSSTTASPSPSTKQPSGDCGSCKGCYFADVKWCVNVAFGQKECEAADGAKWCGK